MPSEISVHLSKNILGKGAPVSDRAYIKKMNAAPDRRPALPVRRAVAPNGGPASISEKIQAFQLEIHPLAPQVLRVTNDQNKGPLQRAAFVAITVSLD